MASLEDNFQELAERVRAGRDLRETGFEPVYYLIFHPGDILRVKHNIRHWKARLHNDGWDVHTFSLADEIQAIFHAAPLRQLWLNADRKDPQNWKRTNRSLEQHIQQGALVTRLGAELDALRNKPRALLLITDLEALHPYLRIGTLEGQLTGRFCAPTVIFYPGKRTGKTRLKFLGFYPEDGNYRSQHVGG
jgi:hypothetical protein